MKSLHPNKLIAVTMTFLLLCVAAIADKEPKQHSDTVTDSFPSGLAGPCTETVTPGSWYCGNCWFYNCGCACIKTTFYATVYTGTSAQETIGIPGGGGMTVLKCIALTKTGTTPVQQQLCYNPD